ncbi:hypothetical protein PR202_ga26167 [Eleusine coracana subsp. coracana]|uniref:Uncharacterized protein n=1 Tax=Eleusine coracana subsp. coracana TaxID=191504 RepID=A0AAV5DDE6_ELECO|nr:hypothetical protein PR202_ga26167 [Eleusine coracana subsp. coracana]
MEKAQLFDFNLTLPAIAIEFLLLMVALDKLYFTPLGKFMDERDAKIRGELGSVKAASEEVKQLEEQAAAVMKAARAEIRRRAQQDEEGDHRRAGGQARRGTPPRRGRARRGARQPRDPEGGGRQGARRADQLA